MSSKRTGDPWIAPRDHGPTLAGAGVNLLVADIERARAFVDAVLELELVYTDPDIAVVRYGGSEWLLHADHTYDRHPLRGFVDGLEGRGAGIELRLYRYPDPDAAERRARDHGYVVLQGCADKPHGLRECFLLDADGYCWVPCRPFD